MSVVHADMVSGSRHISQKRKSSSSENLKIQSRSRSTSGVEGAKGDHVSQVDSLARGGTFITMPRVHSRGRPFHPPRPNPTAFNAPGCPLSFQISTSQPDPPPHSPFPRHRRGRGSPRAPPRSRPTTSAASYPRRGTRRARYASASWADARTPSTASPAPSSSNAACRCRAHSWRTRRRAWALRGSSRSSATDPCGPWKDSIPRTRRGAAAWATEPRDSDAYTRPRLKTNAEKCDAAREERWRSAGHRTARAPNHGASSPSSARRSFAPPPFTGEVKAQLARLQIHRPFIRRLPSYPPRRIEPPTEVQRRPNKTPRR